MAKYLFVLLAVGVVAIVLYVRARKIDTTRFFAMPSTRAGRSSAWLFLAAIAVMAVMSTLLEGALPSIGKLNTGPLVGVLVLVAALITGAVAMIKDRERSWVVWLTVGVPTLILGAEIISLLIPGD